MLFLDILSSKITDRKVAVCKEITKINEAIFVGFPQDILNKFKKNTKITLGEFVVVLEGKENIKKPKDKINERIEFIINKLLGKFSLTDTVEIVHKIGNIEKKEVYKRALDLKNEK